MPLTAAQYRTAFAQLCARIDFYNRRAAELADQLGGYPASVAIPEPVAQVLHYDDCYRRELVRRKYLQEHRMLPTDEPTPTFRKQFKVPTAGLDLGLALRNLSKNVSVWKARCGQARYPEAEQKYAMYLALYQEAKTNAAAERAQRQSLTNDARYDD